MGYVVPFMNGKGGNGQIGAGAGLRGRGGEVRRFGADRRSRRRAADDETLGRSPEDQRPQARDPRRGGDAAPCLGHARPGEPARHRHAGMDGPGNAQDGALVHLLRDPVAGQPHGRSVGGGAPHACAEGNGIEDWRFAVALNALRAATAIEDDRDARAYLAEVGFKALPGFVRDMKDYEIALLQGKAITETGQKALDDDAFGLVNGIAGAVLEAGKTLSRQIEQAKGRTRGSKGSQRDKGGRSR